MALEEKTGRHLSLSLTGSRQPFVIIGRGSAKRRSLARLIKTICGDVNFSTHFPSSDDPEEYEIGEVSLFFPKAWCPGSSLPLPEEKKGTREKGDGFIFFTPLRKHYTFTPPGAVPLSVPSASVPSGENSGDTIH